MIILYHNKRCSKSRACLELIINSNSKYKVINYLEDDMRPAELEALVKGLIDPLEELVRTNEPIIKKKKLTLKIKRILLNC